MFDQNYEINHFQDIKCQELSSIHKHLSGKNAWTHVQSIIEPLLHPSLTRKSLEHWSDGITIQPLTLLQTPFTQIHLAKQSGYHSGDLTNCEAQGKGRAKGGPRKVTQRSFMDGGWWYTFPWCFTLNLVDPPTTTTTTTTTHRKSLIIQD